MQNIVAGPSYILHLYNLWLIPIITLATSHKKKDGLTFKIANPLVNLQAWNPKCNNYILACWKSDSKNYSKVRALNPQVLPTLGMRRNQKSWYLGGLGKLENHHQLLVVNWVSSCVSYWDLIKIFLLCRYPTERGDRGGWK
jgi:hypothetical protein